VIPWVVAGELRATLLDYLRSTWSIADAGVEAALFAFLAGSSGLFQGPYLRLGLPFAAAPLDVPIPLDVVPPYPPHLHQLQAWQRLSSRGQTPQATLITTGTGSGKTECFLYPILDHASRERSAGKGGIKAIILYPMNALASDQAQRFAETIDADERLRGRLRVGLFIGGKGQHREMGRDHVVDDNDRLRANPPDILLTNYRMLDLLLQRPKDAPLWKHNEPDTLRYLVLDELHTYDGAQGTDVACLIRRLGQRLGSAEALCPVGTSATVGGGGDTRTELLRFASTLFDQEFPDEAFIGETRLEPRDLLAGASAAETYPTEPGPWPEAGDAAEAHVKHVVRAWLAPAAVSQVLAKDEDGVTERLDRVALGRAVLTLPIVRALVAAAHRRPSSANEVDAALARELPVFAAGSELQRAGWLAAALSMVSFAQRESAGHVMPLVSVQSTLWVREVRRLLSRVGGPPAFRFHDDAPPPKGEAWVPRYVCRDCGHTGWFLTESGPGDTLGLSYKEVARAYGESAASLRIVHADDELVRQQEAADGSTPRVAFLDPLNSRLLEKPPRDDEVPSVRVYVHQPDGTKVHCPACGGKGLRMIAARSTTLSSVAVGHLFTTPLNTDHKLLAFSDSVQDAAHRAGFYGARTYRFALRTAILAAVPRGGERMPLANLAAATWDHWLQRPVGKGMSPVAELTALLLPVDLHWLGSVEEWHDRLDEYVRNGRHAEEAGESSAASVPEPSPQLLSDLRARLRWECTRELGVASRIGRTLEQSGCVSVTVNEARFYEAVEDARVTLREKVGLEEPPSTQALSGFLAGLLTRLRLRGGVCDPLLEGYVASGGNDFLLNKQRAPLISPFAPTTSRPIFLTTAPKPRQFDSVCPSKVGTWTVDWVARALGLPADPGLATSIYMAVIPALVRKGILRAIPTDERSAIQGGKATAWGLEPEHLEVSRAHVTRRCDACGGELAVVEGSATDLRDGPCLRFRCPGRQREVLPSVPDASAVAALPVANYYRRFYERETLGRLWSKEHTGLLARGPREELELEFKQRPRPDSPNLLSCTPTLEMGIDIGDLSATLLCSVPPNASNYIQRVGRAGRKTGNALVLAFAATRAHDLYFFQEPMEAMAGSIYPPGCYLSAPEVLKRQALAFLFDGFAKEGGSLHGRVGDVLKGEESKRFPKPLFDYVAPRRERLQAAFLEMFKGKLTVTAAAIMREAFEKDGDGLSPLERGLLATTEETRKRREDFRKLVQRLDDRLKQLDTDEIEAKKVVDLDDEKRHLRDEKAFVYHQLMALLEQDVWGWLCEESRLPNYAFPERGVKLDAYIRREGVGREPEHHTWVRSPASALTELAPFNTFYASARRVQIDGITLKNEAPPTLWRFCQSCHHARPHTGTGAPEEQCPACGDGRWPDVGQAREILLLGHVFAVARHRDAVLGDDGDDRERSYYEKLTLFEATADARDAWSNDQAGFGFELQPRMVLRQLNLGPKDDRGNAATTQLAGQSVADVRFILCGTCGQAQEPPDAPSKGGIPRALHRAWCPERKKPIDKQVSRKVHLLRELRSEALRLVVPFADGEDVAADLANLRAALRVGLRRFYGGDPDFLEVSAYDEPLPAREGRRRFLVIMDRVPGGTGLLAELCLDKGAKLKEALEKAHDLLRACACQRREPAVKACYQCLYVYRDGDDLPLLDRARALDIVEDLLDAFGALAKVDTIGTMTQSRILESELEARFVSHLETRVREGGGTWKRDDDGVWKIGIGTRRWLLKAQVVLDADQVAVPCRADFVLYPADASGGVLPVAVFTDGLAFHVMPGMKEGRLADDAKKRLGISQGGEMLSWSLTWKDVVSPDAPAVPTWFGAGAPLSSLQAMVFKVDAQKPGEKLGTLLRILDSDPLRGLVAYLESPARFAELAPLAAFMLLQQGGKRQPAARIASAQEQWRSSENADDLPLLSSEGDVATTQLALGQHARLLLDVEGNSLPSLLHNPGAARVTLRLEDDPAARSEPAFEMSWRLWLRAWNLLQALPGAILVTRGAAGPEILNASSAPPPRPASVVPRTEAAMSARLATVKEVEDEELRRVLTDLLGRHPSLEAPSVPYELRPPAYPMTGDVEIGWPTHRVAAYFDRDSAAAETLRLAGWDVFAIERGPTVEAFEKALGLEET
jgi:DEAD/DEAH box helicase domain-containing protein